MSNPHQVSTCLIISSASVFRFLQKFQRSLNEYLLGSQLCPKMNEEPNSLFDLGFHCITNPLTKAHVIIACILSVMRDLFATWANKSHIGHIGC